STVKPCCAPLRICEVMMKYCKFFIAALVVACVLPLRVDAQLSTGIITPNRSIDWRNAGVAGGIPNRTTICATLASGATIDQINSAISNCQSGQVVRLGGGTYDLGSGIINMKANVTLRGDGADSTKLVFTGRGGCGGPWGVVCMLGPYINGGYGSTP